MFNNIFFFDSLLFYTVLCAWILTDQPSISTNIAANAYQQMTNDCHWSQQLNDDTILVCQLKTFGSEDESNNFNFIDLPNNTKRLRLECIDDFYFQSTLNAGGFRHWNNLEMLEIVFCKIGNLSNNAFNGMSRLRNLTIQTYNTDWSTMGLEIASNVFNINVLNELKRLDLSENNMWLLPAGIFCSLHHLQHLNLSRNRLHDLQSLRMSKVHKCLMNLNVLDLSANNIENLSIHVFSGLKNLRELYMQRNRIHFIADPAFVGLIALYVIRLDGNNLHSLSPELFTDTKQLREIYVQNNSLNVLAPEIFTGLMHLTVLDLSKNQLTSEWINSLTFKGLMKLFTLDLSENQLTKIESTMFKDATNLQVLRLNDNHLRQIQDRAFDGLSQLNTLTLSNNRLFSIEPSIFIGLHSLKLISLDYNRLSKLNTKLFQSTMALDELHLNGNKLEIIPDGLGYVPHLKSLDLGENRIKSLQNIAFTNLTNILGLRLTENYIESIKIGVFDKMMLLRILNLSRNKIAYIEAGAFDRNKQLQAIRLDGNYLKEIVGLFTKLPNLVWLNVSENSLETFEYSMIPTQLQWLDIHSNHIVQLGNYFEIEAQLSLNIFDASSNRLTEITGNSIPNSIEILYLNDNRISRVQAYAFFKKPNITRVELLGNKITTLDPNALRISTVPKGKPLPEFYIGNNPYLCDCNLDWLQKIEPDTRTHPKLMDLNIIYCKLLYNRGKSFMLLTESLPNQFLCKYTSQCHSLCHCCDFGACDCKMDCPNRCTCFHDQNWTSNVIDCSRTNYVEKLPQQIPIEATQIYLDGNDFHEITSHALIGRRKLRVLFLNSSHIETIQNRTFFGLKKLELLNMAENYLKKLNGYEFDGLVNLKELYMQTNQIESINSDTFVQLSQLKILRLDSNRLVNLDFMELPNSLSDLRLSQNPWQCDCVHFEQFKEYVNRELVKDRYRIKCFHPFSLDQPSVGNGTSVSSTTVTPLQIYDYGFVVINVNASIVCSFTELMVSNNSSRSINSNKSITNTNQTAHLLIYQHIPMLVTTLLGLFILILIILLIFIFRQEIRIWFHAQFGVRLFSGSSTHFDKHDKLFDAFVLHSSKDETFVAEQLAPILENGEPPHKLCLYYRDFPADESYDLETIVQAIDSSRSIIMIISKNFIKTEWCRFEFKSAYHQVLRDRRRCLIFIMLKDVTQKDLDPDIRLYLKTNTCLYWGDKTFWQQLRFALPDAEINQCPNNIAMELTASQPHRFIHNNVSSVTTKDQRRNQNVYEVHDIGMNTTAIGHSSLHSNLRSSPILENHQLPGNRNLTANLR